MGRRWWQRDGIQLCAVALASGAITAVVALALRPGSSSDSERQGARAPLTRPGSEPVAVTQRKLARRFGVFRAPAQSADRVVLGRSAKDGSDRGPAGDVDVGFTRQNGLDLGAGRRLRLAPRVFAIPGRGTVCITSEGTGGDCAPASVAGRSFTVNACGHVPRHAFEVSGLIPDSAKAVHLVLADGRRVPMRVSRNFVSARFGARTAGRLPRYVDLSGRSGGARARVSRLTLGQLACEGPS